MKFFNGWTNDDGMSWAECFLDNLMPQIEVELTKTLREDNPVVEEWRCAAHFMTRLLQDYAFAFSDDLCRLAVQRLESVEWRRDQNHANELIKELKNWLVILYQTTETRS